MLCLHKSSEKIGLIEIYRYNSETFESNLLYVCKTLQMVIYVTYVVLFDLKCLMGRQLPLLYCARHSTRLVTAFY